MDGGGIVGGQAITVAQLSLVRASLGQVRPVSEAFAAVFYARLFQIAPDTKRLFAGDPDEQGRRLVTALGDIVDELDRPDRFTPFARALAVRHVAYGACERHYDAVGLALLHTLRLVLGPKFDAATRAAWTATYAVLADAMIDAAGSRTAPAAEPQGHPAS